MAPRKPRARRGRADRQALDALENQVQRLRAARGRLERRLTAAVQEIGALRQFELRVRILEADLAGRDREIARLCSAGDQHAREAKPLAASDPAVSPPA